MVDVRRCKLPAIVDSSPMMECHIFLVLLLVIIASINQLLASIIISILISMKMKLEKILQYYKINLSVKL